ncbi:MAG: hypothetical protein JSS62_03135 [Verrucomicrobia bacterium]|nr:hypothetical protein [Verrucomicrobiota bacterium]
MDFKNAVIQTTSNLAPAIQGISPNLLFSASPLVATLYDLQQQTWLGCTFGTSFVGNNCFAASIEWRFANENAFCIDFNVNF